MKKIITTTLLAVAFISPEIFAGVTEYGAQAMPHHSGMMDKHSVEIGKPGQRSEVAKTLSINANDLMRFDPATLALSPNQTIEFIVTNTGQIPHEFVLGTHGQIETHRQEMTDMPGMKHADSNAVTLKPGETKSLIWQFTSAGEFVAACTIPGHYEAGMITKITVAKSE